MVVKKQAASADFSKIAKNIEDINLENEIENSFLAYSYMVILSRAIPDARDGVKPVHRRILWSMYEDGYTPDKNHVKSAKIVGAVTGNYHTFGDSACYEAMVRLAQGYSLSVPLIDGHGNFGSGPGSSAAASRYTEARLSREALTLLSELKEDGVEMKQNYDSTRLEPTVLPVRFPNLIINGGSGIAVGMASKMAPHNPGEVMDAARWLLTHPAATLDKLMEFVPGPDFPTGARILGTDAIKEAYETGRGTIRIQASHRVEPQSRGKNHIIFTELPYEISAEAVIEGIKKQINAGKLLGVADIKDLTDRLNGTRLVVETKAGINPQALIIELMKLTSLEVSFGMNNVAIVDGEPRTLGLKEQLEIFIKHRIDIVTRRTTFRKEKKETRLHLLEGLLKALANIDEVIKIIRAAADAEVAQSNLMKKFKLDEVQADYILAIPLRRLTKYDSIELNSEQSKLSQELVALNKILNDEKELKSVIAEEFEATKKLIDRPRRSVLVDGALAVHLEAAKAAAKTVTVDVEDESTWVAVYADGSLSRHDNADLKDVKTNTRGKLNPLIDVAPARTRGRIILVTNKGNGHRIDLLHLNATGITKADALVKLPSGERIISVLPVEGENQPGGVGAFFATKDGTVKIASAVWPARSDEFALIKLEAGDEIVSARWVDNIEGAKVSLLSSDASLLVFPADKIRAQGLPGGGIAGIKLAAGQKVIAAAFTPAAEFSSTEVVTFTGVSVKRTPLQAFSEKGRATGGMRAQAMLKGESGLALGAIVSNPIAVNSTGSRVELPPVNPKRDASGVKLTDTIASFGVVSHG